MHILMLVIFYIYTGPVEPKTEIQAEQVQGVFKGPQASSVKDTNLPLDQGKSRCIQPYP
jgi:hypothetical protein